jgi:enamine deaminase RidA (YjgF/YER057c/UK114 family)
VNHPVRPDDVASPAARYELGVVTEAGSTILHTAGIVGARPDGSVPETVGEQADEVWRSVLTILEAGGFEKGDIVNYTTYVVAGVDLKPVMASRDAHLSPHTAASTLITVPALARPEWKVEIAVVAARKP